jgi:hypothetical protein
LLVREFGELRNPDIHRMSVDTYAVQHPGVPERRSIKSVAVHLVALCMTVERGLDTAFATKHMGALVRGVEAQWLEPPVPNGRLTVQHPLDAPASEHAVRVREWAEDVWSAWHAHHPTVRAWLDSYL